MWNRRSERLIDVGKLKTGDIILTRSREIDSSLISLFGRSRFSHAQIVVSDGKSGWTYEATTDKTSTGELVGLVRSVPLFDYIYSCTDKSVVSRHIFAKNIGAYGAFEVLRWRNQGAPAFVRFQKQLSLFCAELKLRPYANIAALARFAPFPTLWIALNKVFGLVPDHVVPGYFCSQLVALAYREGGASLSAVDPSDVTPRSLWELGKDTSSTIGAVPVAELEFSPGDRYVRMTDWRQMKDFVIADSNGSASSMRKLEIIDYGTTNIAKHVEASVEVWGRRAGEWVRRHESAGKD